MSLYLPRLLSKMAGVRRNIAARKATPTRSAAGANASVRGNKPMAAELDQSSRKRRNKGNKGGKMSETMKSSGWSRRGLLGALASAPALGATVTAASAQTTPAQMSAAQQAQAALKDAEGTKLVILGTGA